MCRKEIWQTTEYQIRMYSRYVDLQRRTGAKFFVICAQIEQEIAELEEDEKKMFLEDLGLSESGLQKLIKAS